MTAFARVFLSCEAVNVSLPRCLSGVPVRYAPTPICTYGVPAGGDGTCDARADAPGVRRGVPRSASLRPFLQSTAAVWVNLFHPGGPGFRCLAPSGSPIVGHPRQQPCGTVPVAVICPTSPSTLRGCFRHRGSSASYAGAFDPRSRLSGMSEGYFAPFCGAGMGAVAVFSPPWPTITAKALNSPPCMREFPDFWNENWRHAWVLFLADGDQGNCYAGAWRCPLF